MKYWEFLIQKEGDQTWLPLETQQVEILEGRYRVVAHTDRVNTPLEIRVSQLVTTEMPPRKRVRKRKGQTNETGLVVVMPYVHLKPGKWDLQCSSINVMDDLMGDGWAYDVQLEVFAHTEEDWSSEWPVPADSETVASVIVDNSEPDASGANQDLPLAQAKAELENQLRSHGQLPENQLPEGPSPEGPSPEGQSDSNTAQATSEITDVSTSQSYRVWLRQQAYLARHNQPMTIMGKVSGLLSAATDDDLHGAASQLWIRLQNPQNTQVIMEAHRPLSLARLPADFKVQIQLPAEVTTRVILGEVSLRTAAIDAESPARVLTSTGFTITAGIDQLLDAIANQDPGTFDEEVSVFPGVTDLVTEPKETPAPSLAVPSLDLTHKEVVPAVGVVLPPQLEPRNLEEKAAPAADATQPELPTFANTQPSGEPVLFDPSISQPSESHSESRSPERPEPELENDSFAGQPVEPIAGTEPGISPTINPDSHTETVEQETLAPAARKEASAEPRFNPEPVSDTQSFTPSRTDRLPSSPAMTPPAVVPQPPVVPTAPPSPLSPPPMVSQPAQFVGTSILDDDLEADEIAAVLEDIDKDLLAEQAGLDELEPPGIEGALPIGSVNGYPSSRYDDDRDYANAEAGELAQREGPAERQPDPRQSDHRRRQAERNVAANVDFQSLKMKDHFWKRLSSLTHESHREATELAENMKAAGVSRSQSLPSAPVFPMDNDEVVIYDDPAGEGGGSADPPTARQSTPYSDSYTSAPADRTLTDRAPLPTSRRDDRRPLPQVGAPPLPQLPMQGGAQPTLPSGGQSGSLQSGSSQSNADLPEMVMPVISVPVGDLVAGAQVTISVSTRPSTYKPFIKLWMIDRQSRSLVIEPQLMTNLVPDALGDLQGSTQLRVPMDCLDVQIAAIAVDMATQQESGKAVVNRHVVPASQGSSSGRGFNF
ncbi:MAG: hypothetical protein AAFV90_20170 [Cyanobacteria bacterium J06634_5]